MSRKLVGTSEILLCAVELVVLVGVVDSTVTVPVDVVAFETTEVIFKFERPE